MVEKRKLPIQSVERALDILDCIVRRGIAMRSIDLAKELSLHPSTANNLIRTLYRRGYLSQVGDGRYALGVQCYVLGEIVDRWGELRHLSLPIIQRLAEETGDNAFVGVLMDGRLLTIAYADGTGPVIVSRKHVWAEQVHCTAAGKVLTAFDDKAFVDFSRNRATLMRYTPHTITDLADLRGEFTKIRKHGYAKSRDESVEGVTALGVPVFATEKGSLLCALSQPFPTWNLASGRMSVPARVTVLKRYAREITTSFLSARGLGRER